MISKDGIEFHRLGYAGDFVPAVNVKIYKGIESVALPREEFDPLFTHEWLRTNLSEEFLQDCWNDSLTLGWDHLEDIASGIFEELGIEVFSEGRSGGWAIIPDLKDFTDWEEEDKAKWLDFARRARAEADDIPYRNLDLIYHHVFVPMKEKEEKQLAETAANLQRQIDAGVGCEA